MPHAMEHAEGSIVIEAPLEDVMEVIEDYEAYPEWADVRTVEVRARGEGGRATEVAFEVDVPVLGKASYTLSYRYAQGDTGLSWVTTEARGAVRDIRGEYLLDELDDGDTKVTYRLRCRARRARAGVPAHRGSQARHRERPGEAEAPRRDGLSARPHPIRARQRKLLGMRVVLFTGKGGVGKTTVAAATAVRAAPRGAAHPDHVHRPGALARGFVRGRDRVRPPTIITERCGRNRSTRRSAWKTTGARSRTTSSS